MFTSAGIPSAFKMSDALSISPDPGAAAALAGGTAALASAPAAPWRQARRIEQRRELDLGQGLDFAFATEDIGAPTEWSLQHDKHTLIVHLDGPMRRLDTRIEGAGRLQAAPAAGDLWLIPAGRRYLGRALGGQIAYAELNIDPAHFAGLGQAGAPALQARMKHRDPFVHGLAARLCALATAEDDLAGMLRQALGQALSLHLLREHGQRGGAAAAAPAQRLDRVQRQRIEDYIQAHLDQRITLERLAVLAGLSTHRLLLAFRAAFGQTPIQYVLEQRLRRACTRLRGSAEDIATIAVETGFSSHSHLSSVFKKRYGMTPREYRSRD